MNSTVNVVILSAVALALVFVVGWFIVLNPCVAIGIGPVLGAVALVIRAIAGSSKPPDET